MPILRLIDGNWSCQLCNWRGCLRDGIEHIDDDHGVKGWCVDSLTGDVYGPDGPKEAA